MWARVHSLRFYNVRESLLADGQLDNVTEYASAFRHHSAPRRPTTRQRHTTARPERRVLPLSGVMGKLSELITADELDTHTHPLNPPHTPTLTHTLTLSRPSDDFSTAVGGARSSRSNHPFAPFPSPCPSPRFNRDGRVCVYTYYTHILYIYIYILYIILWARVIYL